MTGGPDRRRGRRLLLAALALVCVAVIAMVGRDVVAGQLFDAGVLCRREHGSLWRTASGCGRMNDTRCGSGEYVGSEFVAERARRLSTWVLAERTLPASGEPPYFDGPHPGVGEYAES